MADNDSEKVKDSQANKYQLTINNPDEHGYTDEKIYKLCWDNFTTLEYMCFSRERATTSTEHYHVFVYFRSKVRFSTIKRSFPEAHIEPCRGTVSQNVAYIKKGGKWKNTEKEETRIEGTFHEWGNQPPDSKGTKGDMTELYEMVRDGMSDLEIIESNQDYIRDLSIIGNLRLKMQRDKYKNIIRKIDVTYIFGVTNSGKTWGIYQQYGAEDVYRVTDYKNPFDGYEGQPILVLDEFRDSINLASILSYLDIYPVDLPARYANKYALYEKVYIISNWSLEEQYKNAQKFDKESWKAFLRRINKVLHYRGRNDIIEYDSVDKYLNRESEWTATKELPKSEQMELPFN